MDDRRPYTMRRRAAAQQQTRDRIVEATVELHTEVGPAATTIAEIAARAGVQRQTVYRHFPDEAHLLGACSQRWTQQHPPPDPGSWASIQDPLDRLERATLDMYEHYRRTRAMTSHVLRDAQRMPLLAELLQPLHEYMQAVESIIVGPFALTGEAGAAMSHLVATLIDFGTWQQLTERRGLSDADAAQLGRRLASGVLAQG